MNVMIIVLDTVRADVFNSLLESGELPNIKQLAEDGIQYTNAKANGPWTVPSHGSIFTGEYPKESGITGESPDYDSVPLIEKLNKEGYRTAGFSANPWLSSQFGFDEPFDYFISRHEYVPSQDRHLGLVYGDKGSRIRTLTQHYDEIVRPDSLLNLGFFAYKYLRRQDEGAHHLISRARNWIDQNGEQPFFMFMNLTEAHLSYELPSEYYPPGLEEKLVDINQQPPDHYAGLSDLDDSDFAVLQEVYRATMKYLDDQLGRLFHEIDWETTSVVLASDHGELLGEGGNFGHQYSLREELLHVPLIISGPNVSSQTVEKPVELRQLYQFICSLAEGSRAHITPQAATLAELHSPSPSPDELRERSSNSLPEYVEKYGRGSRSISRDEYKLIEFANGSKELYEISSEVKDISNCRPEKTAELIETLVQKIGEFEGVSPSSIDVSSSVESRLDDLGYV